MKAENEVIHLPAEADTKLGAGYGNDYLEWKDWSAAAFGALSPREEADFSAQLKKAKTAFRAGSRVLDIGFGNGRFLAYGAKRKWEMQATEVNPGLVDRARQNGFDAVCTETLKPFPDRAFDLVAAFDVMEHIPQDRVLDFLHEIQRVMKADGVFIARFPNGDSPLGLSCQNGDPTHLTTFGSVKARYFAMNAGMEIVYLGGEPQALWAGLPHFAHRLFALPLKSLMNAVINLLFCPRDPLAYCSPNLLMILRKSKSAALK